ncbi:MAG TPA: hypothetical protein VKK31_30740 [Thermoanaerobaculia bacterium]|nr:hypothetical protein [Thermoanaerobaculia bacterium]
MYRRTVHRGIAALALVTVLTVAGAQPAAAHQGFMGRLAEVWSVATGEPSNFLDRLARWFDGGQTAKAPRTTMEKQTWGIDPNGGWLVTPPTDPDPGASNQGN